MHDFDQLPPELRAWTARAARPWRAKSVRKAYDKALKRTGDAQQAIAALDDIQNKLIAKDAARIWGATHPEAGAD